MPTHVQPSRQIAGLILAGGASRRFGSDKALAHLPNDPRTLLDRAIALLSTVAGTVSVVAPADRSYPNLVADFYPGEGPLGGVISGLRACDAPRAIIVAVDQFAISAPTLLRLLNERQRTELTAFRTNDGHVQPLPLAVNRSALPALELAFDQGIRSLAAALVNIGVTLLDPGPNDQLADADEPGDLESVE